LSEQERWVADAAAHYGFRSALIVPAPTPAALSRTGVLCLGSQQPDFFDRDSSAEQAELAVLGVLARSLAMQLGDWMHRVVRDELMASARISADDLRLLQHQRQGHNSKRIAAMLGTEAKTIDCRFQRLNLRLGAANRRAAVRLAELYGLI
jgi:DNA-binding NarL/FixJ family response regulator